MSTFAAGNFEITPYGSGLAAATWEAANSGMGSPSHAENVAIQAMSAANQPDLGGQSR